MKVILFPFMVLAACGLALSIAAHCMALAGIPIPGGNLVWGLQKRLTMQLVLTVSIAPRTRNAPECCDCEGWCDGGLTMAERLP